MSALPARHWCRSAGCALIVSSASPVAGPRELGLHGGGIEHGSEAAVDGAVRARGRDCRLQRPPQRPARCHPPPPGATWPLPDAPGGAGVALAALTSAIWLPEVLGGAGTVGAVVALVVGLLLLGLATNGATLYQLARGYPPLDLPQPSAVRQRAEFRRLLLLTAVPGALVVRTLRLWRRAPTAVPDVATISGGCQVAGTSPGGPAAAAARSSPAGKFKRREPHPSPSPCRPRR